MKNIKVLILVAAFALVGELSAQTTNLQNEVSFEQKLDQRFSYEDNKRNGASDKTSRIQRPTRLRKGKVCRSKQMSKTNRSRAVVQRQTVVEKKRLTPQQKRAAVMKRMAIEAEKMK